jgi:hypothetical protein
MSPRRFALEAVVFGCSVAGAVIGYCAGQQFEQPVIQISLAFAGMAFAGAFSDMCLRGDS